MPTLADPEKALLGSQSGPDAGVALSVAPINFLTRIDASLFPRAPSPSSPPTPCLSLSLSTLLPMWPSIGFLWPPSCSMLESRVVGKEGLRR